MIYEIISKYHELSKVDKHHGFKSWEHCYNFFNANYKGIQEDKTLDHGCLNLAFYLASWGSKNITSISRNKSKSALNTGLTDDVRQYVIQLLEQAKEDGFSSIELTSGDIHKSLNLQNRMPSVCSAMVSLDGYNYEIIHDTPSGARACNYCLGFCEYFSWIQICVAVPMVPVSAVMTRVVLTADFVRSHTIFNADYIGHFMHMKL